MGHTIVMGRKTYESIGRPLDGRDQRLHPGHGGLRRAEAGPRVQDLGRNGQVHLSGDAGSRGGKVIPYKPLVDEACAKAKTPPPKVLIVSRGLDPERSPHRDST